MNDVRPLQRDRERTRRQILEVAGQAVLRRGANVSLADIAREAGITKGGLMHHFRSRDELMAGLVEHVVHQIWEEVMAHVDITENRPGKFTRGYVRALTGGSTTVSDLYSASGLLARLGIDAAMGHMTTLTPDDPERWNRAFEADGLPLARTWAVRYAAEGLALGHNTPYLTDEQLEVARAELLALTEADAG